MMWRKPGNTIKLQSDFITESDINKVVSPTVMVKCDYCGKEITTYLSFKCKFCSRSFCVEHHLPEHHGCPSLKTGRESFEDIETRIVNNFVYNLSYTRSIDGLLIKLGSLISDIDKFISLFDDVSTKQALRKMLFTEKALKALSPFSDYIDDIRLLIENDPRHYSLRDYVDDIMDAINEARKYRPPNVKRTIELIRPSLREIEESEKIAHEEGAVGFAKLSYKVGRRRASLKTIIVVLVVLSVLANFFFDYDMDGLLNYEELWYGTNPLNKDTDGDGLSDADEAYGYGISPQVPLATKLVSQETTLKLQDDYLIVEHSGPTCGLMIE